MGHGRTRSAVVAMATAALVLCLAPAALAATTFTVNETGDQGDASLADNLCDRDTGTAGQQCTLRAAIQQANFTAGADVIAFNFGSQTTISPANPLNQIVGPTTISGGGLVELNGAGAGATTDGLSFGNGAGNSIVDALRIDRFTRDGIRILNADFVKIRNSTIGTDFAGSAGKGNGGNGITIAGSTGTQVGVGTSFAAPNSIVANGGDGINSDSASASAVIESNSIGRDAFSQTDLPNGGDGVDLSGPSNRVGDVGLGNTIINNAGVGILIGGPSGDANDVQGNTVGVDTSDEIRPNGSGGVRITGTGADGNRIGRADAGAGNTISGNVSDGVAIFAGASGNSVVGNRIGTDATGTSPRANQNDGVDVNSSPGNVIGGPAPGAGNVISANLSNGIDFENTPSSNNLVQGNRIGTNAAGTLALPNDGGGITAEGSNVIGGSGPGEGNLVSGNVKEGIQLGNVGSSSVQGNLVGTNASGTGPIPNGTEGIDADQAGATIGGSGGAVNTVAFNLGPGIRVRKSNVVVAENSVFSNGGLGIDSDPAGVTPDTPQRLPTLSAAVASGGQTVVRGTVASGANTVVTLRFSSSPDCDPSGFGEGKTSLGAATVLTDGSGNASFDVTVPAAAAIGQQVTATATGPAGTSEFSACRGVEAPPQIKPAPPAPKRPVVTAVTQSATKWRAGSALAKLTKAKPPVGTTYGFTLNESASVRFEFAQRVAGRRVGRRCVAQTRSNRRKPRCTRTLAAGTLSLSGHAGKNRVRFQGRLSRTKKLKPGRYTVTITATASGLRSAARSLSFTIVQG